MRGGAGDWEPFPAFPPSARLAVVVGHPSEPAPYVVRVKDRGDDPRNK
jgi:hypothetical protein